MKTFVIIAGLLVGTYVYTLLFSKKK